MPKQFGFAVALSALISTIPTARAQTFAGFALDTYDPAERGSDWFELDSLDFRRPAVGVTFDEGFRPLVIYTPGRSSTALVDNQLFLHLGGSFVLWDRLRLSANLPIAIFQEGTGATIGGTFYGAPSTAALGDLRLGADVRLIGSYGDAFSLAAGLQVFVPIGSAQDYAGDGKARLAPHLLAAGQIGAFVYSARVAWMWRPNDATVDFQELGSELQGGLALGARLVDDRLTVGPEIYGSTSVWSTAYLFTRAVTPIEAILGAHLQVGDFKLGAGAGPGLTPGFGSPELRGLISFEWSPAIVTDRDKDGVPDAQDACPDTPGVPTNDPKTNGCPPPPPPPDRDRDGVPDAQDACPDTPGVPTNDPATNGCPPPPPDRDRDGVPDAQDACPDVPGVPTSDPKTNGCPPPPPDRDNDGVPDAQDACPDTPGVPTNDPKTNGCPRDTDGDGVPDAVDNCPTVPGPAANQGCPLKQKQLVIITKEKIEIRDRVYFQTAKAKIQKRSFGLLNQVAAVIEGHPDIAKILVEGHTDNVGSAETNRKLSQGRAEAVRDYLVSKGVDASRLDAQGFGPDRPIDSNATAKGKANNRRVEFKIVGNGDNPPVPLPNP